MSNDTNTNINAAPGSPVAWFEIGTDDPEVARTFYGQLFGWTYAIEGPYSIITTGTGHPLQGGIQDTGVTLPDGTPRTYAIPCVQVTDVGAACGRVAELGGKVVVGPTTTPAGLVYAHVHDPAGNHLGVFAPPA